MTVKDFVSALRDIRLITAVIGDTDQKIEYVSYDSRDVRPNTLFICKGSRFRREFLMRAAETGAAAYISEEDYCIDGCTAIIVSDIRRAIASVTRKFYGDIDKNLELIGITGTKGKSSTAFFLKAIIDEYEISRDKMPAAICSGIYNYDGVSKELSSLTTPENPEIFRHIANAADSGIDYMILEVSSQALKYNRVVNLHFDTACFLNISRDHISPIEHPDFDDYFESKLRIFSQCDTACVNLDADHSDRVMEVASSCDRVITFSRTDPDSDVYGYNINSSGGRVSMDLKLAGDTVHTELAAFGLINVENALAASAMAMSLNIPGEYIAKGLGKALVPGRMEAIFSEDGSRMAIVDYAHNRLSFDKLFDTLKQEFPEKEFVVVAGTVGGKAYQRRRDIAEVVSEYASHFIITEDDYGEEDPCDICEEIAGHMKPGKCSFEIIVNRELALKRALKLCDGNTILIAAGKGHESTIKRGTRSVSMTPDSDVIRKYINNPHFN